MKPETPSTENYSLPPVREVTPDSILCWLNNGWKDLRQSGAPSLLHGVIVAGFSMIILTITLLHWPLLPGAISGFLLVGPFMATGLYALSKKLEHGSRPTFSDVIEAWRHGSRCLWLYSLILVFAATAWVIFSVIMFTLFIDTQISQPMDFLRHVLTQNDGIFMLWSILGGLGSALGFAVTVVALPLLVEHNVSTKQAIYTSVRVVGQNPVTMVLWAMVILMITGLAFMTLMIGFIPIYPILGHASWHAYRDLVDSSGLPAREVFKAHG